MEHGSIKLGMVIFMQHDLGKAVEFYKKMGMKLNFHIPDRWAEFDLGCVRLGMCPVDHTQEPVRTGVVFEVQEDLIELHAKLKADGMHMLNDPVIAPHGIMVGMKDPGNNVFDLYQPTPEKMKEFVDKNKETEEKKDGDADIII
jgi:hypothetical protein